MACFWTLALSLLFRALGLFEIGVRPSLSFDILANIVKGKTRTSIACSVETKLNCW